MTKNPPPCPSHRPLNPERINQTIRQSLAEALEMDPSAIRSDVDIGEYGAGSLVLALIAGDMEKQFDIPIPDAETFSEVSTVDDLAACFMELAKNGKQNP